MSWKQQLVNSQVSVDRAVFEMNRNGFPKGHQLRKERDEIDLGYISIQVKEAIQELTQELRELNEEHTGQKTLF